MKKRLAIVSGCVIPTTMQESKLNIKYNICPALCKTCFDIFGDRTSKQCEKCRTGAIKK